jgi:hypothetical protein
MFDGSQGRSTVPSTSPYRLHVLLLLFLASGCAALIFEVTWLQLLQLVIGSSAVSIAVLLATYMGGMCLGALAAPRVFSTRDIPARVRGARGGHRRRRCVGAPRHSTRRPTSTWRKSDTGSLVFFCAVSSVESVCFLRPC